MSCLSTASLPPASRHRHTCDLLAEVGTRVTGPDRGRGRGWRTAGWTEVVDYSKTVVWVVSKNTTLPRRLSVRVWYRGQNVLRRRTLACGWRLVVRSAVAQLARSLPCELCRREAKLGQGHVWCSARGQSSMSGARLGSCVVTSSLDRGGLCSVGW